MVDAYAAGPPLRVLHGANDGGARSSVRAWALTELPTGEAEFAQLAFRDSEESEVVPAAPEGLLEALRLPSTRRRLLGSGQKLQ